jgi:hypothetical protein
MRSAIRALLLPSLLTIVTMACAADSHPPGHERPFFMPRTERERIRQLVQTEAWAKAEYAKLRETAERGDGYASAFLYALNDDPKHLPAARKWLLARFGPEAWLVATAGKRLADAGFFKAGQVGIPEVYYDTDASGLIAYDWVAKGLDAADRRTIERGIVTCARYKMRCMDRWTQTPNLVFKPTCMVALSGLVAQDRDCVAWGFHRTQPWGARLGGYEQVLGVMLLDGGPWREATIYPIAHEVLLLAAKMSWYCQLYDGQDWWNRAVPNGSTPKGLMDYYLDTAYPIEHTGHGAGQVRVATCGDGATNAKGDLFLVNPAGDGLDCTPALAAAYQASGDSRYGAFLAMAPGYAPNLIDRRPLPARPQLPPAPSKVWPNYGLAMLRSDESPGYWTNSKAIAVFQVLSQGYGHDHRDKFSITLHGANRLLYPDYNAIQYENLATGWTRCSPSHNTLIVDEQEARDAAPTGIRHEFSPEVKFLATSAAGTFEGVEQTRVLMLTREYLLELFHARGKVPHTYDYVLHGFGRVRPAQPELFRPSEALRRRYWLVEKQQAMSADGPWALDFLWQEEPGSRKGRYGDAWYGQRAAVRVSMAGEAKTLVSHGVWGEQLARLVAEHQAGAVLDRLSTLIARRAGVRETVFVAAHEPYRGGEQPQVTHVTRLGQTADAIVVRVDATEFTDYIAASFGPQKDLPEHAVALGPSGTVSFRNYGYLRVARDGRVAARGGWTGWRLPAVAGPATLNGQPVSTTREQGMLALGRPARLPPAPAAEPECPLAVAVTPSAVCTFERDQRIMTFAIRNTLQEKHAVAGRIEFELPAGLATEPSRPEFGPLRSGEETRLAVSFRADKPPAGRHTVPYRVVYRLGDRKEEIRCLAMPVSVIVGPTLELVYRHPEPYFRVSAPRYTARLDMFAGRCRFLADEDAQPRLDGGLLFTFSDGKGEVFGESTTHAFTWPNETPAHLTAHAYDRCRWQAIFLGNRMLVRMDPGWTQFEKTHFTIPGKWISPQGPPQWKRIVALDAAGHESDARPGPAVRVAAAELAFPGGHASLAFQFQPPQEVAFQGSEMKFTLGSLTGDNWSIGFCRPGEFDAWRGKK